MITPIVISLLVLLGLALLIPGTRAVVGPLLQALGSVISGALRRTYRSLTSAARILSWVMAVLTVAVVLCAANGWVEALSVIATLLGSMVLILYLGTSLLPATWVPGLVKFFRYWSAGLFYIALVLLFVPEFTAEITFREISMVFLGLAVLFVLDKLAGWILVTTTGIATAIVLAVMLFGSADLFWTQVRFSNMNQKSLAATEHRIETLEQVKVHYGGLNPAHQNELNDLLALKTRQETAAADADARRSGLSVSTGWLSGLDTFQMLLIFIVLALAAAIVLSMFKPKTQTAGGR